MMGRYKVITLCGNTRFRDEFMEMPERMTLEGEKSWASKLKLFSMNKDAPKKIHVIWSWIIKTSTGSY